MAQYVSTSPLQYALFSHAQYRDLPVQEYSHVIRLARCQRLITYTPGTAIPPQQLYFIPDGQYVLIPYFGIRNKKQQYILPNWAITLAGMSQLYCNLGGMVWQSNRNLIWLIQKLYRVIFNVDLSQQKPPECSSKDTICPFPKFVAYLLGTEIPLGAIRTARFLIRNKGAYQVALKDMQVPIQALRDGVSSQATTKDALEWIRQNMLNGVPISLTTSYKMLRWSGVAFQSLKAAISAACHNDLQFKRRRQQFDDLLKKHLAEDVVWVSFHESWFCFDQVNGNTKVLKFPHSPDGASASPVAMAGQRVALLYAMITTNPLGGEWIPSKAFLAQLTHFKLTLQKSGVDPGAFLSDSSFSLAQFLPSPVWGTMWLVTIPCFGW